MIRHILIILLASTSLYAQNLIINGGFEDGLSQWQNYMSATAGSSSLETTDVKSGSSALRVQVISPGANAW
ncbi:MAG TPA: hypothetical protein VL947_08980, partial [Cytophagales bacterium]|nr:hypothetical protein [Cytophagales bacterium]